MFGFGTDGRQDLHERSRRGLLREAIRADSAMCPRFRRGESRVRTPRAAAGPISMHASEQAVRVESE